MTIRAKDLKSCGEPLLFNIYCSLSIDASEAYLLWRYSFIFPYDDDACGPGCTGGGRRVLRTATRRSAAAIELPNRCIAYTTKTKER